MQRFRLALLALALTSAAAWAVEPPRTAGLQTIADSGADDRERGYSDGLNGRDADERDKDYRAGYSAGRAKHKANEARRPDGKEYARGYRDGFNRYRERIAVPSGDRAYVAGYRAGQADRTARATGDWASDRPTPGQGNALPRPTSARATVGRPAEFLKDDMTALGYRSLGRLKQGGESFTLWRGSSDSDCFRISTARGRVKDVFQVSENECR
jgi:hypothetical protein